MKVSILIPHFKNGKATAYAVAKLLEFSSRHDIQILVINNNVGDGSEDYLYPFRGMINYVGYPKDRLQSHGCAFDWAIERGLVENEVFITIESDSFPVEHNWLDGYECLLKSGCDMAGSILKLSGGQYVHPCGTMYRMSLWKEAKDYCDRIQYTYFPNMSNSYGFDCHLMVHNSILDDFLVEPNDYVELSKGYYGLSTDQMLGKAAFYSPTVNPFHNGMGMLNESVNTYGNRTIESEKFHTLLNNKRLLVNRIGLEPGQWLCYFAAAKGRKIECLPIDVKWLSNREGQQQEYTLNSLGFKHIWAGSSYLDMENTPMHDVYEFKKNQIEELYNSLPNRLKI